MYTMDDVTLAPRSCGIFTARHYASAVYMLSSSVCRSVCLSRTGTVPKRLNVGSRKQRYTIAQGLVFWCQKTRRNSNWVPHTGSPN